MSYEIEAAAPPETAWRVGRSPDAWAWPDWRYAGTDGTFANRYDDPRGEYRVLYACTSRFGALVEALARFRPHPALVSARCELTRDQPAEGLEPGVLPEAWLARRAIGAARALGSYADVGHSRSLRFLRDRLAGEALCAGIGELDAAAIRLSAPRALTQAVSRVAYECALDDGSPQFAGIRKRSRLGDEIDNWTVFERRRGAAPLDAAASEPLSRDDPT